VIAWTKVGMIYGLIRYAQNIYDIFALIFFLLASTVIVNTTMMVIYERMREEFDAGKPLKTGIDGGYDKAFWTIIDSHVTTLITALVLYRFGVETARDAAPSVLFRDSLESGDVVVQYVEGLLMRVLYIPG